MRRSHCIGAHQGGARRRSVAQARGLGFSIYNSPCAAPIGPNVTPSWLQSRGCGLTRAEAAGVVTRNPEAASAALLVINDSCVRMDGASDCGGRSAAGGVSGSGSYSGCH